MTTQSVAALDPPRPISPTPRAAAGTPPFPNSDKPTTSDTAAGDVVMAAGTNSTRTPTRLTVEAVEVFIEQVDDAPGIADEAKVELRNRYQSTIELLQSAEESRRRIAKYEKEIQQGSQSIEAARAELARPPADSTLQPNSNKTVAELETMLRQAEGELKDAQGHLAEREAVLKNRSERRTELTKKIDESRDRLATTIEELSLPAPSNESAEMTAARRAELRARQQSLPTTLAFYQADMKRSDELADLFPLERDLAKREANRLEKEVSSYQTAVANARKLESERQVQETRRQAELTDPALRDLAEYNATLADTRNRLTDQVTRVTAEVKEIAQRLEQLRKNFKAAKRKVKKAGRSTTVALLLRRQRDGLPDGTLSEQRLQFVQQEMPNINLQRMELEDERTMLGDIETAQEQVIRNLHERIGPAPGETLKETVRELLSSESVLLDKLIDDLDRYLFALGELESRHRDLIALAQGYREFIDEHVLWIRSTDPLSLSTLPRIHRGAMAFSDHQQWLQLATVSGVDTLREPWMAVGVLAAVAMLLAFQARLRQRIRKICEDRWNSVGLKLSPSLRALLLTAIASAAWPILIGFIGWRMASSSQATEFGMAVGPALMYVAGIFWLGGFVRSLCRRDGVAETFFSWRRSGCKVGCQAVQWLTWTGAPLASLVVVAHLYRQGEWAESIGRVAFILVMLLLAAFVYTILGRRSNIFCESIVKSPRGWLSRIRIVAYAAGVGVPLVLGLLAAVGYFYSAQQLAIRLQTTVLIGLAIALLHAVISRWFIVKRRRLAMQQARERQQQGQEDGHETSGGVAPASPANDAPDWADVHGRLRLLLRHALTAAMAIALWFVWSDVLPALKILDHVELWSKTVEVTERQEGVDGSIRTVKSLRLERTTLRHGLTAAMTLLGTFVLGRNLPALLEITMLNRLPLDRGGRHALSVILHYSIALTGALVAFRTLGIHWASVQWLAAGITVGLGFGLQEIFANFVSGMILLFERPIRVGDIITLDDVTGTVTNIRIRATTVTDWDRKELIVPNKDLVTGRLLNWTLSNTTTRIVIKVGVAYHTDVTRARDVMEETVISHPNVLKDPPPLITFEAFGDSTLDFVIRAYLSSLDVRLMTIHELHVLLHQRLAKEGIEIAFPQRDLNIRNVEWPAQVVGADRPSVPRHSDAA